MKALSGVERVWSGAPAQKPKEPPARPSGHLAPGGRIGMVMPLVSDDEDDTEQPTYDLVSARRAPVTPPHTATGAVRTRRRTGRTRGAQRADDGTP
ncbi:hypothetical protein ACFVP3_39610 [Streptomyces sp. NPDC057806]|uniref:hypothetical protein n=1 Tax=Streptomyces sp. NPDC057806 TaxID=3346255 RepID=UPI003678A36F